LSFATWIAVKTEKWSSKSENVGSGLKL
jgi:hypothetical protein